MKNSRIVLLLAVASLNFLSCNKKEMELSDPLVTNRDTLVNPADDFFKYANGGWFKNNPIPSTEKSNGIFRTIADTINNQIKQICEKSAQDESAYEPISPGRRGVLVLLVYQVNFASLLPQVYLTTCFAYSPGFCVGLVIYLVRQLITKPISVIVLTERWRNCPIRNNGL